MSKIIDPDLLLVGTDLIINLSARTFDLQVGSGNLVAKDGVTAQALYSKFIELWTTSTYNKYPFPGYVVGDPRAGMFVWGFDGATYNGWKPANDTTRQRIRDAGWREYAGDGDPTREYVGVISLGDVNSGAQLYYQRTNGGSPTNTTFTDAVNEAIQVFGDADNGDFDERTFFKLFCREFGYTYDSANLEVVGETATGPYKVAFPISNAIDLKIVTPTPIWGDPPYNGITVTYYGSDQMRDIGGTEYPFRIIIEGNNATAEQIYSKIQYLLTLATDIDSGAGSVIGKTADALLYFVGDTLYTTTGVYIDNYNAADANRIIFTDKNGSEHSVPFVASGTLNFSPFLVTSGTGYYRMYFDSTPAGDYGEETAVTVEDSDEAEIAGPITGASIPFSFAYGTNEQGGRTKNTDAAVVIVAGNPSSAKPVAATATILAAVGQAFSIVAEQDRGYLNP